MALSPPRTPRCGETGSCFQRAMGCPRDARVHVHGKPPVPDAWLTSDASCAPRKLTELAISSSYGIDGVAVGVAGSLPTAWLASGGMEALRTLSVESPTLRGPLPSPTSVGPRNLTTIDLGLNPRLEGTLPASWSQFT
jgi:hypothetical protein